MAGQLPHLFTDWYSQKFLHNNLIIIHIYKSSHNTLLYIIYAHFTVASGGYFFNEKQNRTNRYAHIIIYKIVAVSKQNELVIKYDVTFIK